MKPLQKQTIPETPMQSPDELLEKAPYKEKGTLIEYENFCEVL